jgi:hypothetical protein
MADELDVLFRLRTHFTEILARSDGNDADSRQLQAKVGEINEQINALVEQGYNGPAERLAVANAALEKLNTKLIDARQSNESVRQGIEIASKVLDVVSTIAGAMI